VPHFGINPKVQKLDAFLQEWSVAPFNQCYDISDLASLPSLITPSSIAQLEVKSSYNIEQVKANYQALIKAMSDD